MKREKEVKVIVDTNIWISYLIGKRLSRLIDILSSPQVSLIFSQELLDEIYDVSQRKKFAKYLSSAEQIGEFIQYLLSIGQMVELPDNILSRCRDSKDDYLLELAIRSNADFLITGDNDLLIIAQIEQCRIVSIMEFEILWSMDETNIMTLNEP